MKQKVFVAQPSEDGMYEVTRWNEQKQQYYPLKGQKFTTSEEAKENALKFNEEYEVQPSMTEEDEKD